MDPFEKAKQMLSSVIAEVEDSCLCCSICTERYNDTTNAPILFRCKHTFCQKCVQHRYHFKTFAGQDGLCVFDRTQRIDNVQGERNMFILECMRQLTLATKVAKEMGERSLRKNIDALQRENEKLEEHIIRTSELMATTDKSVRKLKAMNDEHKLGEFSRTELQDKIRFERDNNNATRQNIAYLREETRKVRHEIENARSRKQKAMLQAVNELQQEKQQPQKVNGGRRKKANRKKGRQTSSDEDMSLKEAMLQNMETVTRAKPKLSNPFTLLNLDDSDQDE